MIELKAKANWVGQEGKIRRGQVFTPATEDRAAQLVKEGRAVIMMPAIAPKVEEGKATAAPKKPRKPKIDGGE